MPSREIYSTVAVTQALAPQSRTATIASSAVDTQDFDSCLLTSSIGTPGITLSATDKIGVQLQESDTTTDGDFTNVAAADTNNGESLVEYTANAQLPAAAVFSYRGVKRYARLRFVFSGTHGAGTVVSATALRGHPLTAPVSQPN